MKFDEEQALLAAAAAPILEQIREDREAAIPPLQPLLRHLEDHLFDPDLDAEGWLEMGVVAVDVMREIFRRQIGIEPETYLWDRRLHAALQLLRDTSLSITAIGEMVGFSGRQAFSDAFEDWLGERPAAYREDAQALAITYGNPPEWMLSEAFLQRLENGRLSVEEANAVRERLQHVRDLMDLEDGNENEPAAAQDEEDNVGFEKLMALELWQKIEHRPFKEQKVFVANQVTYTTTALRDLLVEKSKEVKGTARHERSQLASLAEESLERTLNGQTGLKLPC